MLSDPTEFVNPIDTHGSLDSMQHTCIEYFLFDEDNWKLEELRTQSWKLRKKLPPVG